MISDERFAGEIREKAISVLKGRKILDRDQLWESVNKLDPHPDICASDIYLDIVDAQWLPAPPRPFDGFVSYSRRAQARMVFYLKEEFGHADLRKHAERLMCVDWLIDQGDDRAAKALLNTLKWSKDRKAPNYYQKTTIDSLGYFLHHQYPHSQYVRADGTCRVVWRGVPQYRADEMVHVCRDLGIPCTTTGGYASVYSQVAVVIPENNPLEK